MTHMKFLLKQRKSCDPYAIINNDKNLQTPEILRAWDGSQMLPQIDEKGNILH